MKKDIEKIGVLVFLLMICIVLIVSPTLFGLIDEKASGTVRKWATVGATTAGVLIVFFLPLLPVVKLALIALGLIAIAMLLRSDLQEWFPGYSDTKSSTFEMAVAEDMSPDPLQNKMDQLTTIAKMTGASQDEAEKILKEAKKLPFGAQTLRGGLSLPGGLPTVSMGANFSNDGALKYRPGGPGPGIVPAGGKVIKSQALNAIDKRYQRKAKNDGKKLRAKKSNGALMEYYPNGKVIQLR